MPQNCHIEAGNAPKASVIIPLYNADRYIQQCLQSLLDQSLKDFEVIVVDNHSTDASLDVAKSMAMRDRRITILESDGFAGDARNAGMSQARGEYLLFLDADDFFAPELLTETVAAAEGCQADIVLYNGRRFDDATGKAIGSADFLRSDLLPRKEVFSALDIPDSVFRITTPAPWTKLFRRAFVESRGLRFQSLQNSNDMLFTLSALACADRICALKKELVFYRVNVSNSLQESKAKNPLCFIEALGALKDQLLNMEKYELLEQSFQHQVLSTIKYNLESSKLQDTRLLILDAVEDARIIGPEWHALSKGGAKDEFTAFLYQFVSAALLQRKREKGLGQPISPTLEVVVAASEDARPIKVSVIVPVYNTSSFVGETLESLLDQTLADIEIICIDDGSTDDSREILEAYARKDSRISVFTQRNSGLSMARNAGMSVARGKYFYFMDSDDILEPNALEFSLNEAEKDALDVLLFDAASFFESEELRRKHGSYEAYYTRSRSYKTTQSGPELLAAMAQNGDYRPSACLYITRAELIRERCLSFIPGIYHEDNAYTFELLMGARRASHRKVPLYLRRVREDSTMTGSVVFSHCYGYFASSRRMREVVRDSAGLDDATRAIALGVAWDATTTAQWRYIDMPEGERGGEFALSPAEYAEFSAVVGKGSASAQCGIQLRKLKKSRFFQLGRALVEPYRKIKRRLCSS